MKRLSFLIAFFYSVSIYGQTDSIVTKTPAFYPKWMIFVPGATHFHENRILEGVLFSATELGGLTFGILYDKKLRNNSSSPYYNFPLLIGIQAFNIDKCDYICNNLAYRKSRQPDFKYDPIPFNDLLKAPFQPKNFLTPVTGGLIALAVAELYLSGRHTNQYFGDINQMNFVDRYMDKKPALAIYGTTSLAASYGAGIAEEYIFRNGLLPVWDYEYGQKKGLLYSSLLFGSMHLGNMMMTKNPDLKSTLLQVGEATLIGYFLGNDVQKRGYKIGPSVAAHMWYDFTLMLGSFLIDPKNNYLGVNMTFKI